MTTAIIMPERYSHRCLVLNFTNQWNGMKWCSLLFCAVVIRIFFHFIVGIQYENVKSWIEHVLLHTHTHTYSFVNTRCKLRLRLKYSSPKLFFSVSSLEFFFLNSNLVACDWTIDTDGWRRWCDGNSIIWYSYYIYVCGLSERVHLYPLYSSLYWRYWMEIIFIQRVYDMWRIKCSYTNEAKEVDYQPFVDWQLC